MSNCPDLSLMMIDGSKLHWLDTNTLTSSITRTRGSGSLDFLLLSFSFTQNINIHLLPVRGHTPHCLHSTHYLHISAFALLGSSMAQRSRSGRAQRPRGGRQETGYSAPADYDYAAPAQPAYGDDQDVYQVRSNTDLT